MAFVSFWSWTLPLPPPVHQVHPVRALSPSCPHWGTGNPLVWPPSGPALPALPENGKGGMWKQPQNILGSLGRAGALLPRTVLPPSRPRGPLPGSSGAPPAQKRLGGALLHLSLLPLPDLRGEKNANFGKTLWVLTGKGRGYSPHWRHPGDPFTYTPFQIPSSNFF